MEIFVPDRAPRDVIALMDALKALGLAGRDAAYLASVAPPAPDQPAERARYRLEFEFMVPPPARAGVAALVGL